MNPLLWLERVLLSLVGLVTGTAALVAASSDIVVEETQLGPLPTDMRQLSITPDGNHAALVGMAGSRPVVYVDGNASPPYSAVNQLSPLGPAQPGRAPFLAWSADNSRVAYIANRSGQFMLVENGREGPAYDGITGLAFSPVGHRLAYLARKGTQMTPAGGIDWFVVVDGTPGPAWRSVTSNEVQFSADGEHLGYIAGAVSGNLPNFVVFDGKTSPGYADVSDLRLSPSGGHYAYIAQFLRTNQVVKEVVVDGVEGPPFVEIRGVGFSADGKHVAYLAAKMGTPASPQQRWMAVIDGTPGPEFQQMAGNQVVFSPDGQHTAYAGTDLVNGRYAAFAVVDGNKSLDYQSCSDFLYSPDSRHLAYLATNGGKTVVVLDGRESDAHQSVDRQSLKFSPDGAHLGYVAQDGNDWHVVIDNRAGPARPFVEGKSFEFSPDGQHYRFKVRTYSDWATIVDDREMDINAAPASVVTTDDWQHSASVALTNAGQSSQTAQVLLDGKPVGPTFSQVSLLQISPDGRRVAFASPQRDDTGKTEDHVVVDGHAGPGYFRIAKILFSPDSQHVAYVAWENGAKQFVVIDGVAGPAFDQVLGDANAQPGMMQFRPDGSLDYYAAKDGKFAHVMFTAATIAALPKPAVSATGLPMGGYAEVYAFGSVDKDGNKPAILAAGPDGTLYGATSGGGQYRYGVIFKVKSDGSGYTILHQILGGQNDGTYPSSLLVGRDGALYGTFLAQGPTGNGSIFRCSAADGSDFKILHADVRDLDSPEPRLVAAAADGSVFGVSGRTTTSMPTHLFRMTPDGAFTKIFDAPFQYGDYNGLGPIADGADGFFYGVFAGKIFKLKQDGTGYAVLHTFAGPPLDATIADRAPLVGKDGRLYGEAYGGGQTGGGIVYSLARDGSDYKVIVNPESEQLSPKALVEGPDGNLYALVTKGVARFHKDGSDYTIIYAVDSGQVPAVAVVDQDALYAMKVYGGKGSGSIFRYGLAGEGAESAAPSFVIKDVPPTPLPAI